MSVYIITEYFKECKINGYKPMLEGLYEFKNLWKN